MIKGMTGFGSAVLNSGKIRGTIEIKSLNHRYLDIAYYLPPGFASLENKIQQIVEKYVQRGRLTVSVRITHRPGQRLIFNKELVKQYLKHAKNFHKEFKVDGQIPMKDLFKLPGVVEVKEIVLEADLLWPRIEAGVTTAMKGLDYMRQREGKSLGLDIGDKLRRMLLEIRKIQSRAKALLESKKKILNTEEFLSFQKNSDVHEEISRLTHHIQEMRLLLHSGVGAGKKIDFIAQEMQRETNTIGSKLADTLVSNAVIALKSKIEKIREQSQNIE